ncbi:protein CutA homolog [Xiphophorus couchianus]|uniref:protein CutA homolog n=1 Tax=Xiphophorus couchianus TaxID=32473 RepID=UPI001016480A|nr:protein CutA homolog [Xiphophorus couchianus]
MVTTCHSALCRKTFAAVTMELVLWWWHRVPRLQRWHRRAFLNRTARLMVMEATLWMILSISVYPDVRSIVNVLHATFTGNHGSTYDSVLLISCPNEQTAQDIGRSVMEKNLAARVNILPGNTAMYKWKSKTQVGSGILILVKTLSTIRAVEAHIRSINPCAKLEAKFFVGRYSALHEADNDIFPLRLIKA